jgi:hypothetical protein
VILDRILLPVVLVVFLRAVEGAGRGDLRHDRLRKRLDLFDLPQRLFRDPLLILGVVEDLGPVRAADATQSQNWRSAVVGSRAPDPIDS